MAAEPSAATGQALGRAPGDVADYARPTAATGVWD